ncbi:exocyst complex component EXO70A1-like protein [Carex littledalei]|uniref:Exocyst subunit Exo70 family protein n=1 Tax=Carex littledalei TaxID=544730 RepID=A0A833VPW5_9POAL|nr:exocyst complex component EXO70A1-like protein [Carex littledalei]
MEVLTQRAALLREALEKSKTNTESMVTILGSFDSRLSTLDSAMRPIQARTHAVRTAHENIDKTLRSADVILSQFDITYEAEKIIMRGPNEDLRGYLEAVDRLRSVARFFSSNKSYKSSDGVLSHVNSLLAKAISKMESEFQKQITSRSKPVEPDRLFDCLPSSLRPSSESPSHSSEMGKNSANGNLSEKQEVAVYTPPTLIDSRFVPLLSKLAQQLVQAGHHAQCLKLYRDARASALEMSLKNLGVEKLSKEEVQKMQWESLEAKIGNWIHFMRIAVKLLFAAERQLCNKIFEGVDSLKDECFAEIEMIFEGKACAEMRESALTLAKRLAETAQETFADFVDAVEKDATKTTVTDGTVHPLTSYVINYVKFLFDYQSTLKQLFQEFGTSGDESHSQLATVTMRIMQALQTNLDAKSKQYKDQALTSLFLMNNIHYMVRSVRRSEAKDLLGDDWIQRHRRIVQQNANQYRRVAWSKILQSIAAQGLTSSGGGTGAGDSGSGGASRALIKDRFRSFNIQIEELYQRQCQWTVPDPELRESLRLAVAEVLLPAYRSFIKRFGPLVENSKNPQKYIKYTPEDLEKMLGEFFEGKAAVEVRR